MDTRTAYTETAHADATHIEEQTAYTKQQMEELLSKLVDVCIEEYARKNNAGWSKIFKRLER